MTNYKVSNDIQEKLNAFIEALMKESEKIDKGSIKTSMEEVLCEIDDVDDSCSNIINEIEATRDRLDALRSSVSRLINNLKG